MNRNTFSLNKITKIFYLLSLLTSSFDVFLVLNISGLNFRISQLLSSFFFILTVLIILKNKVRLFWPLGFSLLLIWLFFIFIFIPNTDYLKFSIGYTFWLFFNILLIFFTVQFFCTFKSLYQLIRIYLFSFFIVALFGLFQFFSPFLHLGAPLITQWWIPGLLPRINGFSYEPSFFSTYLLMGWVLCAYFLKHKTEIISRKWLKIIFMTETLVMVLSSSRIGIAMMFLWWGQYPLLFIYDMLRGKIRWSNLRNTFFLFCFFVFFGVFIFTLVDITKISFLLTGTGLIGTASHSIDERYSAAFDTWRIFLNSPFIGYSLGGIPPALGDLRGILVNSTEFVKQNTGINVLIEILAASGVIGFIPIITYFLSLMYFPFVLAGKIIDKLKKDVLKAMVYSFIFEFAILQVNQNILRPYFWFHLSILSSLYIVLKQESRSSAEVQLKNI